MARGLWGLDVDGFVVHDGPKMVDRFLDSYYTRCLPVLPLLPLQCAEENHSTECFNGGTPGKSKLSIRMCSPAVATKSGVKYSELATRFLGLS